MDDHAGRGAPPGSRRLLARILEEPGLVAAVRALEPRALARLIDHVGLEDSAEIVSLATTDQLVQVFDEDLWAAERPGRGERFDAARFCLWLEVLREAGDAFAADRIAALPVELVMLGLLRQVLVVNLDELAVAFSSRGGDDDEMVQKALEGALSCEFGEYQVIARRHDGWDAIVALLAALDERHRDLFETMMARLCAISSERIEEDGGLHEALGAAESLEEDVAAERDERRARTGFVSPADAAAFLALARATGLDAIARARGEDPVTRAHFREYAPEPHGGARAPRPAASSEATLDTGRLEAVLVDEGVLDDGRPGRLLKGGTASPTAQESLFHRAAASLLEDDPEAHERRRVELGYLANVLVAGCSIDGRRFRPVEAVEAAIAACALGLEHRVGGADDGGPALEGAVRLLARESAVKLFRIGWRTVYTDVQLAACDALRRALTRRARAERDRVAALKLTSVAKAAKDAAAASAPWQARRALGILEGRLDASMLETLSALLDECPTIAPAGADDGRAPGFIATPAQVCWTRTFLKGL